MIEIEKTFLVKNIPTDLNLYKVNKIKQGYISEQPSPLRIRQKNDKFEITKKLPLKEGDYSLAEEINIPLTEIEFNKLWPLTERFLEKDRYNIPIGNNLMAELDIYKGKLEGLAVVEVEFTSEEQMNSFQPLEWFGRDVTQEEFSNNSFLAGKKFEEIEEYIK